MLLKLDPDRDTAADLHRLIQDELNDILRAAATVDDDRARRIHLGAKRIRSYLRLLRGVLGDKRYKRENRFFRDFARPFGEVRNHEIQGKTLSLLEDVLTGPELAELQAMTTETHVRPEVTSLIPVMTAVTTAQQRFGVIVHGKVRLRGQIKQLYRRGRRLFKMARQLPLADNLHEWRKQAKYLRYAIGAVEEAGPQDVEWRKRLKKLAKVLGEHHDLSLLHDRLLVADVPPADAIAAIAERQAALGTRALEMGARIYDDKPRAFIDGLVSGMHRPHSA